jgi:hypothetical protein
MNKLFVIGIVVFVIFISGCVQEEVTCNKPYIKVGSSCCLDVNENGICDSDEEVTTTITTTTTIPDEDEKEAISQLSKGIWIESASGNSVVIKNLGRNTINVNEILMTIGGSEVSCTWSLTFIRPNSTSTCNLTSSCVGDEIVAAGPSNTVQKVCNGVTETTSTTTTTLESFALLSIEVASDKYVIVKNTGTKSINTDEIDVTIDGGQVSCTWSNSEIAPDAISTCTLPSVCTWSEVTVSGPANTDEKIC